MPPALPPAELDHSVMSPSLVVMLPPAVTAAVPLSRMAAAAAVLVSAKLASLMLPP